MIQGPPIQQAAYEEWLPGGSAGDKVRQQQQQQQQHQEPHQISRREQLMTSILTDEDELISMHRVQVHSFKFLFNISFLILSMVRQIIVE